MPDNYLTVAEIAQELKLNPQTIRNWIDRGELAAIRVGTRRVRVRQSDLDEFIRAGSPESVDREPASTATDEGSVTAWAAFGSALAETTTKLSRSDRSEVVAVLDRLTEATQALADSLRATDMDGRG